MTLNLKLKQRQGTRKIVFTNQKGGVGKTTTSRELGVYLASLGYKVLLVDADPQGNLTKSLSEEGPGLYEALTTFRESGEGLTIESAAENLSILKGGVKLAFLEKHLLGEIDAYTRFKDLFAVQEFQDFEIILLDTPPSLGILTINALTACSDLIIPTSCGLYSLQGTNDLLATVAKVRKGLNPELSILGVIINAFDSIPVITRQIRAEIESSFGKTVFKTALSRSIKLEEAIASGKGVIHHEKLGTSRSKEEVSAIGDELLQRLGMVSDERSASNE